MSVGWPQWGWELGSVSRPTLWANKAGFFEVHPLEKDEKTAPTPMTVKATVRGHTWNACLSGPMGTEGISLRCWGDLQRHRCSEQANRRSYLTVWKRRLQGWGRRLCQLCGPGARSPQRLASGRGEGRGHVPGFVSRAPAAPHSWTWAPPVPHKGPVFRAVLQGWSQTFSMGQSVKSVCARV